MQQVFIVPRNYKTSSTLSVFLPSFLSVRFVLYTRSFSRLIDVLRFISITSWFIQVIKSVFLTLSSKKKQKDLIQFLRCNIAWVMIKHPQYKNSAKVNFVCLNQRIISQMSGLCFCKSKCNSHHFFLLAYLAGRTMVEPTLPEIQRFCLAFAFAFPGHRDPAGSWAEDVPRGIGLSQLFPPRRLCTALSLLPFDLTHNRPVC